MPQHHPIATWSPERDLWEGEEDIFGHLVVFSETLPKRGMTVGGRLYELPMSAPLTTGQGFSSSPHLPTPKAHDGEFGMPRTSGRPIEKSTHLQTIVAHHFPTPVAQPSGNTPEEHLRKKPGRSTVTDLAIVVENGLLETGGKVLPTPVVTDAAGARNATANRSNPNSKHHAGVTLTDAVTVLPTPNASDASGGGQHPSKRVGHSRQLIDYVLSIGDSTDPLFDIGSD